MKPKQMSRRSFLKIFAGATASTLLLPISKLFNKQRSLSNKTNSTREAKYYKTADKLAG
ncbi:MAG: twin-arginine translocation signal domain-containing protein [Candidatus Omnitrophica bacterium]|nr:twin-arginine translocation signal domain-containing protein [Candidatus Omnitrophota bacterium]MBU1995748.1 twin-arginine translocation signal domain-containing protein [Candidatus Omnitrophota bacterium]MBU4334493.1 twin-arginine translocation signal domain-containing protein [Candidatus Omnitrophota bacterium]